MTTRAVETAGGVQLVDTPGRPAQPAESERGEHSKESVLSLETGAGPQKLKGASVAVTRPPARPVRFDDPTRDASYWARVARIVDQAPPLTSDQRARIRAAFHQSEARRAAA